MTSSEARADQFVQAEAASRRRLSQVPDAMKALTLAVAGLALVCGGACAKPVDYMYFPDQAQRVLSGDPTAFREVLAKAETTPPGERLEELAEISSRYVRLSPEEFLRGQASGSGCFGVAFMGPDYVDNPQAVAGELALRRKALASVSDPELAPVRQRCLAALADGG